MAKQFIIAAMEEVFGEYILNISKENLSIGVLKGQITLENVQLDGDLFGSHILGAIGLTSYGVLSCCAKSIEISVPWKSLEVTPTKFNVRGIHLVCVPLTPSTANKQYGSGSFADPLCSLRTRAKRLALSRLERNFWNGQIPNEGPVMKRIQRAVKDVERELSSSKRRSHHKKRSNVSSANLSDSEIIDNIVYSLGGSGHGSDWQFDRRSATTQSTTSTDGNSDPQLDCDDLPELPRDWKVRLREKVLRNMEASMHDVHIRLEVPKRGLDISGGGHNRPSETNAWKDTGEPAFAIGFTLESFVVRTANKDWEVGSHDTRKNMDESQMSHEQDHLGPNPYVDFNNKIGYFNKLSIYWDDSPPILLSETDALRGNNRKLSADKIHSRIAAAMDALSTSQEPGAAIRESLSVEVPSDLDLNRPHRYVCESFDAEIRCRTSDRVEPGPISCSADVLPFNLTFEIRPDQYFQYQRLQAALKSQHRLDTMMRHRPDQSPLKNPRAWWMYAIACVTSRPNARPWEDVQKIARCRSRYVELVVKNNSKRSSGSGFHAGLSSKESAELLEMEEFLPIEALMALHLVALRQAFNGKKGNVESQNSVADFHTAGSPKTKIRGSGRFRILRHSSRKKGQAHTLPITADSSPLHSSSKRPEQSTDEQTAASSMSILEAMTLRLGKKTWFIFWKLHDAKLNVVLERNIDGAPLLHLVLRATGLARSFGKGNRDFSFAMTQFDLLNNKGDKVLFFGGNDLTVLDESDSFTELDQFLKQPQEFLSVVDFRKQQDKPGLDMLTPSSFLELPPLGTVCRLVAGKSDDAFKLSISANPATLVWTTSFFDGVTEFWVDKSSTARADLTEQIRNVATPLARKAQLALLSPLSFSFHLNIAAPKVWVPLVASKNEGTLLLDAGIIKMSSSKNEGEIEAQWNFEARDIGVIFERGLNLSRLGSDTYWTLRSYSAQFPRNAPCRDSAILRPISIEAQSHLVHSKSSSDTMRVVEVDVSPICLNLVDAEILARTFGKWYARGIHRFRDRVSVGDISKEVQPAKNSMQSVENLQDDVSFKALPRTISIQVQKLELALEGHSKRTVSSSDDKSMTSVDSIPDYAPPTRAYLVEITQISLSRTTHAHIERTMMMVADISIVRLPPASLSTPIGAGCYGLTETENCILVRSDSLQCAVCPAPEYSNHLRFPENQVHPPELVRLSFLHNRHCHLDEVEMDVESIILKVTPTTLKDCAKAFRRIAEFAQLMTKEMERKVHEEGRKARRRIYQIGSARDGDESNNETVYAQLDRPASPAESMLTDVSLPANINSTKNPSDSCILFKITLKESTLLAGRPTTSFQRKSPRNLSPSYAVIQVITNALVMFQSIENPDATGKKTMHVSVNNVSALVNTCFERVSLEDAPPMIEPTAAEFRIVYATENFGCVVSQDISFDCEALKASVTPNDLSIMINISRSLFDRLRAFGVQGDIHHHPKKNMLSALIRYQKKGTGIATQIRCEVQTFSFVLLRAYRSYFGAPEFLDFNVRQVKGVLDGCVSALSGEVAATVCINFFNSDIGDWEYAVEPFPLLINVEQMPNELVANISLSSPVQLNVTGIFLRDFAQMRFDIRRDRPDGDSSNNSELTASVLSTVGLRHATEARYISITNQTGLDLHVSSDNLALNQEDGFVINGTTIFVNEISGLDNDGATLSIRPAASAVEIIGEREPQTKLPLHSLNSPLLFCMKPSAAAFISPGHAELLRCLDNTASLESMLTESAPVMDSSYYNSEPVIEFCMQNQRLKPSVIDLYSISKGKDLLSTNVWSPEDEAHPEDVDFVTHELGQEATIETDGPEAGAGAMQYRPMSPERSVTPVSPRVPAKSHWSRPYLKSDVPEWTDMTCTQTIARERLLLPDSKWMWVNDWTVNIEGKLSEETDADGWSYECDFETFSRKKRYYQRGDACRRRRWTRTRVLRPPKLNDPLRQVKFVWETSKDENGCVSITIRSHLQIKNATDTSLVLFAYSPSWDEDILVGSTASGETMKVPAQFSSALYLRIAKKAGVQEPSSLLDCVFSDRFCIVPTSHTSSYYLRTALDLKDVTGTTLHFLVKVCSKLGVVDVIIEPVLRLVNLLPCQLECQVGQIVRSRELTQGRLKSPRGKGPNLVAMTESLSIESGKTCACTAVNPWLKPHLSFRVPGYKWSSWRRIVNRKPNSTWLPSESEEENHFSPKADSEFAHELQTLVSFERLESGGDPLTIIMSVECGHCPTVRVYSQYWIIDKTGFGCCFSEGFTDIMGNIPDPETIRRSYLSREELRHPDMKADMTIHGHQWSIGSSGMSLYFSRKEKLALAIETGIGRYSKSSKRVKSKWISPLDISNVIPKTVFSVDELNGPRRFELAIYVTICPGLFARTKLIQLLPRYQVVNLLHRELAIAQDGCLEAETIIPSQTAVAFHWENGSLPPKVRLGAPGLEERTSGMYGHCWTPGRFQLDRIGITSLRLPTKKTQASVPMVVQVEVRLAMKDQSSAVVVVIWSGNEKSNPLYMIRNLTRHTILCRQPLQEEDSEIVGTSGEFGLIENCGNEHNSNTSVFECTGTEIGPFIRSFVRQDRIEEYEWILRTNETICFGFDDPEKPHILEWTYVHNRSPRFEKGSKKAFLEVDAMGTSSTLTLPGGPTVCCQIRAEHSTKVIEFTEDLSVGPNFFSSMASLRQCSLALMQNNAASSSPEDEDTVSYSLRLDIQTLSVSFVDNANPGVYGREILLAQLENLYFAFSQTREGYHELELRLLSFQVDNHVQKSFHPVLIFFPGANGSDPLLHMSLVRRLQSDSNTLVFRYAAIRLLEIEIYLDRRTAETIASFIGPLMLLGEEAKDEPPDWAAKLTARMERNFARIDQRMPREIEKTIHMANSGRIYVEQLHLHPVMIGLTFTQEWLDLNSDSDTMMVFQFIRGMASIANAPLVFTSFVVGHVFESPQALARIVGTHYSSQLTKQVFGIVGSLAILGAPADFISNVGTGVRDFFYEPILGAVHGPRQFIEGLEAGTQSLARGVFVGVVRGAANVAEAVNGNLAGLTADEDFIDERKAHQRMLTDAMSRGAARRTLGDSLSLAYASIARGVKSGALGIVEQPAMYASKHGPVGFLKGVGKAMLGAVVKPVVGLGDGAVLVMNHMSDLTSKKQVCLKIPKRLRRALPSRSPDKKNCVRLEPYDERAAKAQKIVTGGESLDDVYIGHINIASHLIIASEQCFWAIDRRSREPWCVNWEDMSHFSIQNGVMRIVVFSQTGPKTYVFHVDTQRQADRIQKLLSMQVQRMANVSALNDSLHLAENDGILIRHVPGVRSRQVQHVFGSYNNPRRLIDSSVRDEIDLVEFCFKRVRKMNSSSSTFFQNLDEEAWSLVSTWGHLFSGLSSRRCVVCSIINGTGFPLQIKSSKLLEGGSACYMLGTREFDKEQGTLHAGGVILFFGWGVVPNLLQAGNVFMRIETNGFVADLADQKGRATSATALPGYQVGFLEKSYDDSGWWAKYWILVHSDG